MRINRCILFVNEESFAQTFGDSYLHNSLFLHSFLSYISSPQLQLIMLKERSSESMSLNKMKTNDFYPNKKTPILLLLILLPHPPLNSRAFRNPLNPLQQMRERFHILMTETREFPTFNPRPGADICNAVFAFAVTGEVFAWGTGVFA